MDGRLLRRQVHRRLHALERVQRTLDVSGARGARHALDREAHFRPLGRRRRHSASIIPPMGMRSIVRRQEVGPPGAAD